MFSNLSYAQISGDERLSIFDLLNMDLEELMQVDVVSVVDSDENLRASSIQRIGREEILTYGYTSLEEVLESALGFSIINNGFYLSGEQRGISGSFAGMLLLVDGKEIQSLHNGQAFITAGLSLQNVEEVEIIHGPGGVRYGANAFSGSVNIKTRTASSNSDFVEAKLELGSNPSSSSALVFSKELDEGVRLSGSIEYSLNNGFDYSPIISDSAKYRLNYPMLDQESKRLYKNTSIHVPITLKLSYNGFYLGSNFNTHIFKNKGQQFLNLVDRNSNLDKRRFSLFYAGWGTKIKYKHFLNFEIKNTHESIWGENRRVEVNQSRFDSISSAAAAGGELEIDQNEIDNWFTEIYDQRENGGSNLFSLNGTYNTFFGRDFCLHTEFNLESYRLLPVENNYKSPLASNIDLGEEMLTYSTFSKQEWFVELEKAFLKLNLFFITGARWSHHKLLGHQLNFEGAAIYQPFRQTYIKLIYNSGYREPNLYQLFNVNTGGYNELLKPEKVSSFELSGLHAINKVLKLNLATYTMFRSNSIVGLGSDLYRNSSKNSIISGLETSIRYSITRVQADLNYSFVKANDRSVIYNHRFNAGLSYRLFPKLYIGSRINVYPATETASGNPLLSQTSTFASKTILDLNISTRDIEFSRYKWNAFLKFNNLFSTTFYQPNLDRSGPIQFQNSKLEILLGLQFKFL